MEENAYITSIIAGAFYLIASLRLLRLNQRTRERPELLLGLYFGFSGAYYITFNLPSLGGFEHWAIAANWMTEWIYVLGVFPYLFFIRCVFRQEDGWAAALAGICSLLLLAGTAMGTLDERVVYSLKNPWFLVQWVGYTTPCVWMCCEALLSRHGARKRVRIGLCSPIVANRYLLLALFGCFQTLACFADLLFAADIDDSQAASLLSGVLLGGTEFASVGVLWLAFFPPRFYSGWIAQRAEIHSAPVEG